MYKKKPDNYQYNNISTESINYLFYKNVDTFVMIYIIEYYLIS